MAFVTHAAFDELTHLADAGRMVQIREDLGFLSSERLAKLAAFSEEIGVRAAHLIGLEAPYALLRCNNGSAQISPVGKPLDLADAFPSWVGVVLSAQDELRIHGFDEAVLIDGLFHAIQSGGRAVAECRTHFVDEVFDVQLRVSLKQNSEGKPAVSLHRDDRKQVMMVRGEKAIVSADENGFEENRFVGLDRPLRHNEAEILAPHERIWEILHDHLNVAPALAM